MAEINQRKNCNKRKNNSGYYINCPMCIDFGQNRNDTRHRCGITFSGRNVLIHCYNCNFASRYDYSTKRLSKKMKMFMTKLNIDEITIKKVIMQSNMHSSYSIPEKPKTIYNLPENSNSFSYYIANNVSNKNFNDCLTYLFNLIKKRELHF